MQSLWSLTLAIVILTLNQLQYNVQANYETNYTAQEREALKKFSEIVKDSLYLDYQKSDSYLIAWLRASNMDLQSAKVKLEKSLAWRKENGIDSIIEEKDMINFRRAFPFSSDAVDKHNHPVLEYSVSNWQTRKYVLAGKLVQLKRYSTYMYEVAMERMREVGAQTKTEVNQYVLLINLNAFNLRQHTCIACVPVSVDVAEQYEAHYPGRANKTILINAPRIFQTFLTSYRTLINPALYKNVNLFGLNREEWRPYLSSIIDDDQLTPEYGGNRVRRRTA